MVHTHALSLHMMMTCAVGGDIGSARSAARPSFFRGSLQVRLNRLGERVPGDGDLWGGF